MIAKKHITKSKTKDKSKKMAEIDVEFWTQKQYLCEIGQITGIHYAFVSPEADGSRQCHHWIKCRDFLHDALRSHYTGKTEVIFGFSYVPGTNPPLDIEKMRMLFKRNAPSGESNMSENTRDIAKAGLALVHHMEKYGGIEPLSKLYRTSGDKDVYMFEGSSEWMESTFMISLYTFLIRLGAKKLVFKDKEDLDSQLKDLKPSPSGCDNDIDYLKTVRPFLHKIIEERNNFKYVKEDGSRLLDSKPVSVFHNYTGIVSLCREIAGPQKSGIVELAGLSKYIKEEENKPTKVRKAKAAGV